MCQTFTIANCYDSDRLKQALDNINFMLHKGCLLCFLDKSPANQILNVPNTLTHHQLVDLAAYTRHVHHSDPIQHQLSDPKHYSNTLQ